jgi:hypothetical protein
MVCTLFSRLAARGWSCVKSTGSATGGRSRKPGANGGYTKIRARVLEPHCIPLSKTAQSQICRKSAFVTVWQRKDLWRQPEEADRPGSVECNHFFSLVSILKKIHFHIPTNVSPDQQTRIVWSSVASCHHPISFIGRFWPFISRIYRWPSVDHRVIRILYIEKKVLTKIRKIPMPSSFQIVVCTQVSCALVDVALLHLSLFKRDCANVWAFITHTATSIIHICIKHQG